MDPQKIKAIMKWPRPKNLMEVSEELLGLGRILL